MTELPPDEILLAIVQSPQDCPDCICSVTMPTIARQLPARSKFLFTPTGGTIWDLLPRGSNWSMIELLVFLNNLGNV
jgi:hypothetical protein